MKHIRMFSHAAVILTVLAFAAAISSPALAAAGVKYKTTGAFTDSGGAQHSWSINDAHTLLWDGAAYIPVGGAFVPKYISSGDSEENYKADVAALEALKAKGITDIIIKAGKPITSTDPVAWQRIITYLDTNDFTYGVELADGPKEPLSAYLVSPNRYRLDGPTEKTEINCDWPGVDSAFYAVINKADTSKFKQKGGAVMQNGKPVVKLSEPLGATNILIIYPHKTSKTVAEGGIGDMWSGFGEYRDRVLAFFKGIKFGQGMRFFLEPFTSKMDFTGDQVNLIPDSAGFRLGFEGYLLRKYTHEGSINSAWGMNEHFDTAEVAARLLPLWSAGRGIPKMYDRASAKEYAVDTTATQYWKDLFDYRDLSSQEYMNTIASALRKNVANVPVIFKSEKYHKLYANPFGMGGYDGLGVEAYGTGVTPVLKAAGGVYSLAEESGKSTWYIAASTQAVAKGGTGYTNEFEMTGSLDSLREVGCKGFFLDDIQAAASGEQINWLKGFKDKLNAALLTDYKPTVIAFPAFTPTGAYVKRLMPDTWWLPSLRQGKNADIGDTLCAYTLAGEGKSYLWSDTGATAITLKVGPAGPPTLEFPTGTMTVDKKRGYYTLQLNDSPTVIRGADFNTLFPYETAKLEVDRLAAAIPEADKQKIDTKQALSGLENAKAVMQNGQMMIAYGMAHETLQSLWTQLGTDIWLEGEQSTAYSFDGINAQPGSSNGLTLALDEDEDPALTPYTAIYSFEAPENASYEVWIAGTPPEYASPASFGIDDINWAPIAATDANTQNYAPGLAWYKLGTTNVFPGKHNVKIRIDGKRQSDGRYFFTVDAIVLCPKSFTPNGVRKQQ